MRGFPLHLLKDVRKEIMNLIREGYLLSKPSTSKIYVSLNPRMLDEILKVIN